MTAFKEKENDEVKLKVSYRGPNQDDVPTVEKRTITSKDFLDDSITVSNRYEQDEQTAKNREAQRDINFKMQIPMSVISSHMSQSQSEDKEESKAFSSVKLDKIVESM